MTKIEKTFNDVMVCRGDIWVADYTNRTNALPKGERKGVHDCECMCRPKNVGKGWLLLCELKYCKIDNICKNANKAYRQLVDTWKLLDGKGFYDRKHCKVFLNISMPEHELSPFSGFVTSQDEQLEFMKKHKLHLMGINSVLAVNSGILLVDSPEI